MFIIAGISIIACMIQGAVVIPEDQIVAPNVSLQPPYLALLPTLVTQQDSVTHELLRKLITSVNQIKDKEVLAALQQTTGKDAISSNAVKLDDIGDGHKIHIVAVKRVNWFNALELCKSLGLQLISLQTKEKSLRLQAYMAAHGYNDYMWTSGIRLDTTWIWSATSEVFTYTGWHSSQPDKGNEYCVLVQPGYWADTVCSSLEYAGYICEPTS